MMFFESIINGLGILLHWQTYVVALIYLTTTVVTFIIPLLSLHSPTIIVVHLLIKPIIDAIALFICICILFPLMMGFKHADWTLPFDIFSEEPRIAIITIIIVLCISIIAPLMPVIGRLKTFITLNCGAIILLSMILITSKTTSNPTILDADLIPGWPLLIGFTIISAVLSWLGILIAAGASSIILPTKYAPYAVILFDCVAGFISISIYGAWISIQITPLMN